MKFHPILTAEKVLDAYGKKLPENFRIFDKSISDLFDNISILVYSDTTVAMEAVTIGIPSVYLDIGKGMAGDPLFNNTSLKWSASAPEKLKKTVFLITNISSDELVRQRKNAKEYVDRYFYPITEENIQKFL